MMATLVTFHAHPDDEAIACGGTMAKAAAAGHRVVLVTATGGEQGEVPDGFLGSEETVAQRRREERGNYGHPDHIQVHRVGVRAAGLAGVERVFEATINRDEFRRMFHRAAELGLADLPDIEGVGDEMGLPEAMLTTAVDVSAQLEVKRRAMAAHASQIAPESFFLTMPEAAFAAAFGTAWYRLRGAPP